MVFKTGLVKIQAKCKSNNQILL